ncbi:hypothetical protein FJV46_07325 [Arthrobacter agilis]|uniref:hypothetical protein n=1 Tax=Arthrobacter agilis TaxID=37921 RepID=UPI000B34BA2F|nr:hypothetical protein [Arthrobacter agilis]OUM42964.1 hypothetical protein B8W74_06855 [Arthrobacter agilis]PPB45909.1 hypothetical protein CI784_09050 [Arthrobacter agilis]TPV25450.1 hypothetical protein FJV46_07325 [Arthrobacter agilis]
MNASTLTRKTLRAGILVGLVGLAVMIATGPWLNGLYQNGSIQPGTLMLLSSLISAIGSFCLPFSAALIAASLVMRHRDGSEGGAVGDRRNPEGASEDATRGVPAAPKDHGS